MTTYLAFSPRKRTEHRTYRDALDQLIDDAETLAEKKKDPALQEMYADAADYMRSNWRLWLGMARLELHDAWGNPSVFQIITQPQLEGVVS